MDELLPIVLEVGAVNLKCMELLDKANTETYGNPVPTEVSLTVEKGPFIIISGHDLFDLKQLLEQTKDKGINIYTHGEMLPAHGYPELKKYPHLKGNFGTAWQNQQKEFASIPAPVLFTTNCLMPPKTSYADRVFTTEAVAYPGLAHIGPEKDFSPVIQKALGTGRPTPQPCSLLVSMAEEPSQPALDATRSCPMRTKWSKQSSAERSDISSWLAAAMEQSRDAATILSL